MMIGLIAGLSNWMYIRESQSWFTCLNGFKSINFLTHTDLFLSVFKHGNGHTQTYQSRARRCNQLMQEPHNWLSVWSTTDAIPFLVHRISSIANTNEWLGGLDSVQDLQCSRVVQTSIKMCSRMPFGKWNCWHRLYTDNYPVNRCLPWTEQSEQGSVTQNDWGLFLNVLWQCSCLL